MNLHSCGVYLSSATDSYGSMATMDLIGGATELLWVYYDEKQVLLMLQ